MLSQLEIKRHEDVITFSTLALLILQVLNSEHFMIT